MDEKQGVILVDVSQWDDEVFESSLLERFGHPVKVCHGPAHGHICPLLAGTGCELVEQAHGIIFQLDLDRTQHRKILQRYREVTRPEVPIRAVVTPKQAEIYATALDGVEVWTHQPTTADLDGFAAEVEAADR